VTAATLRQAAAPHGAAARELIESNFQLGVAAPLICAAFGVPASNTRPAALGRIKQRTLVINGAFDHVTPPAYGATVARRIPGARLLTFPAGHSPAGQVGACGPQVIERFLDGRRRIGGCSSTAATSRSRVR